MRGADVIALQEVTRNNPKNGGRDMVAELREALPDYFAVFGPNFEADFGSAMKDGRAVDVQVTRLRRKIEPDPRLPRYLQTVRGRGYVLRPDE